MELHLSHANAHSGLILTSSIDFLLHRWIWKLWFQRAYCYGSFLGVNFISGHHMVSRDLTNYGWLLSSSFSSSQPDNYPPVLYQLPLTFLQIGNQKAGFSLDVLHSMEGCVCVCVRTHARACAHAWWRETDTKEDVKRRFKWKQSRNHHP